MSYKAVPHLDHADMLEVAIYRKDHPFDKEPISTITVECTKCGEVVAEVYNASEDNTSPLDCEFPEADRRTWEEGVQDAVRIVQNEKRHKKALDHPNTKVHPAVFETLNEVELHLAAMLSRGSYESRDTVMQIGAEERKARLNDIWFSGRGPAGGDICPEDQEEFHQLLQEEVCVGDPRPIPCPDCGGTGSNCAKYPIVGCATCEGDGRLQTNLRWEQNEVQFARLLCEVVATSPVGQNPDIHALAESMDLTPSNVRELFDRAEKVWEKAKAEAK